MFSKGCDINSVDKQDWTSLHHAAYHGHLEIAKILLSANLESFINTANSVLHLAVLGGHINMVLYIFFFTIIMMINLINTQFL